MADPRALRISAALTTAVLALALAAGPVAGLPLMAVQTFVFAFGAVLGLQAQPYVLLARRIASRRAARAAAKAEATAADTAAGAPDANGTAAGQTDVRGATAAEPVPSTTPRATVAEVPFQVEQGIGMLLTASALLWGTLGAPIPFYVLGGIAAALALVNVVTGKSIGGALIHTLEHASTRASAQVGRLADAIDARAAARQAATAETGDEAMPSSLVDSTASATTRAIDFYDFEADNGDRPVVTATGDSRRADARVG